MKRWFATKREANKALSMLGLDCSEFRVWKWTHTKRKRPFFLGTEFEWLNAG